MRKFFTKKKIIIGIILLVVIVVIVSSIVRGGAGSSDILTDTAKKQDLKQTVLATGQVTSSVDLNLSFKGSGIVAKVNFPVGQKVNAGDILASLDQKDQAASLTQARGSLAQAQANYNKVVAGAAGPEIDIARASVTAAQTTLSNAQSAYAATVSQQNVLVKNALSLLLNSGIAALPDTMASSSVTPSVSGTYTAEQQGVYKIEIITTSVGKQFSFSGLEKGAVKIFAGVPQALGARGLYLTFPNNVNLENGLQWTVSLPNTQASTYTANITNYQSALQARDQALLNAQNMVNTAQSNLDQANASLAQKQAAARPEDVAAARAQVLSAQGLVQAASANLENTVIRAPASGTITAVDIKVGEQSTPGTQAIILQDVDNLYVEANISEANIAQIKTGQEVSFTFDALGPDRTFRGMVLTVDPSSTVVSGVVNYKVTASVEKLPEIKPGMTANMTVLTATKANVLSVPQRAVLSKDGKKFVRVIDNDKKKTFHEVEVVTGMDADGGLVEIISGLSESQSIVTFINTK